MAIVILTAMVILFAAAAYLANKLFGQAALAGVVGVFAIIFVALFALNGLNFNSPASGSNTGVGEFFTKK
jgi:hypothetical protein